MCDPIRDYGSHHLDAVRRTLSLQLRAILYDEGLVSSPDLPLRPLPSCYCVRLPEDRDRSGIEVEGTKANPE